MNIELFNFAARVRQWISTGGDANFNAWALALFALQFRFNPAYQRFCAARGQTPEGVKHWTQIPAAPTVAFKELELSCLTPEERSVVFHSSGTTGQTPSRHFHRAESLAVYEASLLGGFERKLGSGDRLFFLTPERSAAPHSSLIYMFDALRRQRALSESVFLGAMAGDGSWAVDFPAVIRELQSATTTGQPLMLLGTAFSFVHLLDHLAENDWRFRLPAGSRVMETGGYKNRSRSLPKAQLHDMIRDGLGVPTAQIVCEYGMSELSSQAYAVGNSQPFHFPPWARVQIVSPETGREVVEGGTGIVRVFDLANVFSVAAIQTEDLAVRRGDGFEWTGRAERAETRGCSLMAVNP